jgi:protein O-mannosyl-transferase
VSKKKAKQKKSDSKRTPPKGAGSSGVSQSFEKRNRTVPPWLACALLTVLCVAIYANSLGNGMVKWDDVIVTGAWQKDLSLTQIKNEIFHFRGSYQPVRNLSHILDYQLFGKNLLGYRLHTIVLYILNVLLVYWLLLFLLRKYILVRSETMSAGNGEPPGRVTVQVENVALAIAALFAVHPVHVEAVDWLSARKEVLFGLFYLLSVYLYVRKEDWQGRRALLGYVGSWLAFILSLLSKPSAASLPLVLLAYDLIVLRPPARAWKKRIFLHLPFWIPFAAALVYFVKLAGTTATRWSALSLYENILTAQKGLVKYAEILFYPVRLSARYFIHPGKSLLDPAVIAGSIISLGSLAFFLYCLKKRPLISFALAWFYLNWLPTAGFIPISTKVADRYVYLAMLGVCILVTALILKVGDAISNSVEQRRKVLAYGATTVLTVMVLVLSLATVSQNGVWKNEVALWENMAANSPTDLAFNHLAKYYLGKGNLDKAESCYRASLRLGPNQVDVWNNLGNILLLQKKAAEAEPALEKALALTREASVKKAGGMIKGTLVNLSVALIMQKKFDQAEAKLSELVSLSPNDYRGWDLLAEVRLNMKDYPGALKAAAHLAKLQPDKAKPYIYMAIAYRALGETNKAAAAYQKAMEVQPEVVRAYAERARRLQSSGGKSGSR